MKHQYNRATAIRNRIEIMRRAELMKPIVKSDDNKDEALVVKLQALIRLKSSLDTWYVEGHVYTNYKNQVHNSYKYAFEDNAITQEDVDTFLQRYKDKQLELSDKFDYKSDADKLKSFFDANGGSSIVDTLQMNAKACMLRYDEYRQLEKLFNTVEADSLYYQTVIAPNMNALLTTDDDLTRAEGWKTNMENFKSTYAADADAVVKSQYTAAYQNYSNSVLTVIKIIDNLKTAKGKAALREKNKSIYNKLTPQQQIASNPSIPANLGKEGVSYIEKGKADDPDKPNLKKLKSEKLLNKDSTYNIFQKGDQDANEVDMNDAVQGMLGDCFLISAIASVARANPDHIKSLITHKDGDAYVTVKLYMRDKTGARTATEIPVDFYFPFKETKEAFAKKGDNELWVMLIEKAYAKEMGGYDNIANGGNAGEALAVLTGNESTYSKIDADDEALAKALDGAIAAGGAAVAGTKEHNEISGGYSAVPTSETSTESYKVALSGGNQVLCNHAYSILSVDKNAKTVKLRNPHGGADAVFSITFTEFRACFSGFNAVNVPKTK